MVVLSDKVLDGLGSLPSVVMRDLARNVMSDVGLANSVKDVLSDRTKELSVKRAKSTLGKGPLFGRVVGYTRRWKYPVSVIPRHEQLRIPLPPTRLTHAKEDQCAEQT
jgi:hypothetical protein